MAAGSADDESAVSFYDLRPLSREVWTIGGPSFIMEAIMVRKVDVPGDGDRVTLSLRGADFRPIYLWNKDSETYERSVPECSLRWEVDDTGSEMVRLRFEVVNRKRLTTSSCVFGGSPLSCVVAVNGADGTVKSLFRTMSPFEIHKRAESTATSHLRFGPAPSEVGDRRLELEEGIDLCLGVGTAPHMVGTVNESSSLNHDDGVPPPLIAELSDALSSVSFHHPRDPLPFSTPWAPPPLQAALSGSSSSGGRRVVVQSRASAAAAASSVGHRDHEEDDDDEEGILHSASQRSDFSMIRFIFQGNPDNTDRPFPRATSSD